MTSSLGQSSRCAKAGGGVAEGQAFAVGRNPVGIRHAHARGGAVPGEADIAIPGVNLAKVRQFAIGGGDRLAIGELELLDRIRHPTFTEALPRDHGHGARAEHGPHRHFISARVRCRDNANAMRIGHLEHFAHQVDGKLQA